MRSVGDHNWLNDFVGMAYIPGGRGPDAVDCYGLCKLIYSEVFDIDLPDWQEDIHQLKARGETIESVLHSGEWNELSEPVEGCFVVCHGQRMGYHIGLYFAGGVIHAEEGFGVIFEPIARFAGRHHKVTFGDWSP